ncbi:MAG: hypothetical protein KDA91_05705 [Planctomycetaceae bacterium]|nr:hypothetical protein [Planctomycetaceae bacterium]
MKKLSFVAALVVTSITVLSPERSFSQEPHHPRVTVLHPGFDSLKADLKSIIDLTNETEQEQWVNLNDYIDMFQIGIDGGRPVRVDVLTGMTPTGYLIWIPLAPPEGKSSLGDEFRDNLDALGYSTVRDPQERTLYSVQVVEGPETDGGWMRVIPDLKYAVLTLTTSTSNLPILRQLMMKAGDPLKDVENLLGDNAAMAAELVNSAQTSEDMEKRVTAFAELRRVTMDTIQKRPAESTTEFELRQALMQHQLNELQRLMVQASEIRATLNVDRSDHKAALGLTAKAIPGTDLAETIAEFDTQPDAFDGIAPLKDSALSVRVNHPLDKMRQGHANETLDLIKKDLDSRIEADKDLNDAQRTATRQLLDGLMNLTKDGIATGYINAMVESSPVGDGKFNTVACLSAPNATRLNELLPLLKDAGNGNTVETNVETVGKVVIHRVQLAEGYIGIVDRFFGANQALLVGVADNHVWLASGPDASATLKSVIESLGEPARNGVVAHIELRGLPWVQHFQEVAKTGTDEGKTPEEKEARRAMERTRLRAIDAMKGNDDMVVFDVKVADSVVNIDLTMETGILRFAGKMAAAFSKENFE